MKSIREQLQPLASPPKILTPEELEIQKRKVSKVLYGVEEFPDYVFKFGKHKDVTLLKVFKEDKQYLIWLREQIWPDPTLKQFLKQVKL